MFPVKREKQNLIRFLKELAIDILNTPEYENRIIHFETAADVVSFTFDQTLFTRAFRNLIINAFVHGNENTEITLRVLVSDFVLKIDLSDNGRGMRPEITEHLFDRYYRGTDTRQKPEGSGLGWQSPGVLSSCTAAEFLLPVSLISGQLFKLNF